MNLNLEGKTALVCGASKGIGLAVAQVLSSLNASVCLMARNKDSLTEALKTLKPGNHSYVVADAEHPEDFSENLSNLLNHYKSFNILVNNSGGPAPGPAYLASTESFEKAFKQHLIANQVLTQLLLPGMKETGYGRIINIISTSVKQPLQGLGVSNTIRGAVASWSKTLASELAPFGITVNNVLPGATSTERLSAIIENKASKTGKSLEIITDEMLSEIPAKRFAQPEEIAAAVAFLASTQAAYINGINLPVDGGRTLCL